MIKCAACTHPILDRYMLQADGRLWHEDCLRCALCHCRLGEMGSKLFMKQDLIMCETDYRRLYGYRGICTGCRQVIPPYDMVMRVKNNLYHLKCFRCSVCSESFVVGERFRLHENQILCESDWRELRLFSQAAYNDRSLNQIARNLREMPDFQPTDEEESNCSTREC
ncbi:hypothetical protein Q1695_001372 [Nippostrongylus brasiliensis]|nr:hypothetical protein Q1695_001372 [Nippostrongylus brasiliensis]